MSLEEIPLKKEENIDSEMAFQRYMEDLFLSPDDFDKKILDVGSGEAFFSKWAKEYSVSSQIYNLDLDNFFREKKEAFKGRFKTCQ